MARRFWLMKTEPDTFGIDDLARVQIEPWTGVRNYQARNLMRDQMQVGDDVLFYHSSVSPPGVAGLARVHRTGVVDATQFDPSSKYHDPDSDPDDPRWICVDVAFVEKFPVLVPLDVLRAQPGLEDMVLLRRGMRLSVQPVTAAEHKIIVKMARVQRPAEVTTASTSPSRDRSRPRPGRSTGPSKAARR